MIHMENATMNTAGNCHTTFTTQINKQINLLINNVHRAQNRTHVDRILRSK